MLTLTLVLAAAHVVILTILVGNALYLRRWSGMAPLKDLPSVSILIPARNEEDNLQRLLPSLLSQDYPDFEVIVYDDGSEDQTWEVIQSFYDERLKPLRGSGPPSGWVGKVHALFQATRYASGELYLFLDADVRLEDVEALQRLVQRYATLPQASVLTGLTRLRGGGMLLVSLVPNVILTALPWFLVRVLKQRSLGALNGQCWMIPAETYHLYEPHQNLPDEVLEDVQIGRLLTERGVTPLIVDVQSEVSVFMYPDFGAAWEGFRKNAYLILGGSPVTFVPLLAMFVTVYLLAPFVSPWLLVGVYVIKGVSDWISRFPVWVTLLAPVSYLLGVVLQLHSAISHWTGTVSWKGRPVGR